MDWRTECTLSEFPDDSKLSGAVDTLVARETIQRDPDRLERQAYMNFVKFIKANYKVLYLGWGNPEHQYKLGDEWIEKSPEKTLG